MHRGQKSGESNTIYMHDCCHIVSCTPFFHPLLHPSPLHHPFFHPSPIHSLLPSLTYPPSSTHHLSTLLYPLPLHLPCNKPVCHRRNTSTAIPCHNKTVYQNIWKYVREVYKSIQEYTRVYKSIQEYARVCNSMQQCARIYKSKAWWPHSSHFQTDLWWLLPVYPAAPSPGGSLGQTLGNWERKTFLAALSSRPFFGVCGGESQGRLGTRGPERKTSTAITYAPLY